MKLQFKEKHLCFIVNQLSNVVLSQNFNLVYQIKSKLNETSYQPDDLVEIEVDSNSLIEIYKELGYKYEYLFSEINRQMKTVLLTEFTAKMNVYYALLAAKPEIGLGDYSNVTELEAIVISEASEINEINTAITTRSNSADAEIEGMTNNGRTLIYN
jgi:hypothetical protein